MPFFSLTFDAETKKIIRPKSPHQQFANNFCREIVEDLRCQFQSPPTRTRHSIETWDRLPCLHAKKAILDELRINRQHLSKTFVCAAALNSGLTT